MYLFFKSVIEYLPNVLTYLNCVNDLIRIFYFLFFITAVCKMCAFDRGVSFS